VYGVYVPNRRHRRNAKVQHRTPRPAQAGAALIVREATSVERLAYSRAQAAEALGISRSTFDRRVLPLLETVEMPWGTKLIPAEELQRLMSQGRRLARESGRVVPLGRPPGVAAEIADRIRAAHAAGRSLGQIARELNAEAVATAHGGAQWWPSTVRGVLRRALT
jgi:hypothetical protein